MLKNEVSYFSTSSMEAKIFLEFSSLGSKATAWVRNSLAALKSLSALAFSALYFYGSEVAIGVAACSTLAPLPYIMAPKQ